MGYQETYVKMKKSEDFNKLLKVIKKNGKNSFKTAEPVRIITIKEGFAGRQFIQRYGELSEKYFCFDKGEKFLYVVGERGSQICSDRFFEYCEDVPEDILKNIEFYFTENFPSTKIFYEGWGEHENFTWAEEI
ncbi:hypothetical protein [Natranaerobius trueperi]|uniref:Uncharacterized protein n=1 Tax=Natranaerobius trueperi TaxID=759412 RepID=A0A226BZC4_9FIRM|nr:hypothetical protein [Natranaerobius trueperi]OWZ84383.1 hypothetical protein CDO51_03730 [Natranaerobius trueperi]